jgi:hypothetical protein
MGESERREREREGSLEPSFTYPATGKKQPESKTKCS